VITDKKQIFIVDDDESVRRSLCILLGTYGFKVETFNSAEKFFHAVPDSVSGCLILDIHMPGMDGWEALKWMEESGSRRPVIIITADKNGGFNRGGALKTRIVGFLQKPFTDQALVDLIKSTFDKE
jgi:FixJ family two-component response regulator